MTKAVKCDLNNIADKSSNTCWQLIREIKDKNNKEKRFLNFSLKGINGSIFPILFT